MGFAPSSLLHPGCFGNPKSSHDARADMVCDGVHGVATYAGALPQAFPLLAITERKSQHGALCTQGKVIFPLTPPKKVLPHLLECKRWR